MVTPFWFAKLCLVSVAFLLLLSIGEKRLRVPRHMNVGRPDLVLQSLTTARHLARKTWSAWHLNAVICACVSLGRYREALHYAKTKRAQPNVLTDQAYMLIDINAAEAMANLGQFDEALSSLKPTLELLALVPRIGLFVAGIAAHQAWVLWCLQRSDEALTKLDASEEEIRNLGDYQAEYHSTMALVLIGLHRLEDAEQALQRAEKVCVRVSSQRTLLVTRARLLNARGELENAELHYRRAAEHLYEFQNADGRLEWGELLMRLNRAAEARAAWQLALTRDPESHWASLARTRLAETSGAAPTAEPSLNG